MTGNMKQIRVEDEGLQADTQLGEELKEEMNQRTKNCVFALNCVRDQIMHLDFFVFRDEE